MILTGIIMCGFHNTKRVLVSYVTERTGIEPAKFLHPAAFKAVSSTNRTLSNKNSQRTSKSKRRTLRCRLSSCHIIS